MSTEFEKQCTKVVLDAIAKVRKQKQRPSLERVSAALLNLVTRHHSQLSSAPGSQTVQHTTSHLPSTPLTLADAAKWIDLTVRCGTVDREDIDGVVSFREHAVAVVSKNSTKSGEILSNNMEMFLTKNDQRVGSPMTLESEKGEAVLLKESSKSSKRRIEQNVQTSRSALIHGASCTLDGSGTTKRSQASEVKQGRVSPGTSISNLSRTNVSEMSVCHICSRVEDDLDNLTALVCTKCGCRGHPSCLKFSPTLTRTVSRQNDWQCFNCKACSLCLQSSRVICRPEDMLICDGCDKGFHSECCGAADEKLQIGRWFCVTCRELKLSEIDSNTVHRSKADLHHSALKSHGGVRTAVCNDDDPYHFNSDGETSFIISNTTRTKQPVILEPPLLTAATATTGIEDGTPGESVVGSSSDVSFSLPPTLYAADSSVSSTQNDHQAEEASIVVQHGSSPASAYRGGQYCQACQSISTANPSSLIDNGAIASELSCRSSHNCKASNIDILDNTMNAAVVLDRLSVIQHARATAAVSKLKGLAAATVAVSKSRRNSVGCDVGAAVGNKHIKASSARIESRSASCLSPRPKAISPRGLVDSLSQFFTPSDKRMSRVSLNALPSAVPVQSAHTDLSVPVSAELNSNSITNRVNRQETGNNQDADGKVILKSASHYISNKCNPLSSGSYEEDYYTPKLTSKRIKLNDGTGNECGSSRRIENGIITNSAGRDIQITKNRPSLGKTDKQDKMRSEKGLCTVSVADRKRCDEGLHSNLNGAQASLQKLVNDTSNALLSGDGGINLQENMSLGQTEHGRSCVKNSPLDISAMELAQDDMSHDNDNDKGLVVRWEPRSGMKGSEGSVSSASRKRSRSTQLDSLNDSLSHWFAASGDRKRTPRPTLPISSYGFQLQKVSGKHRTVYSSKYTAKSSAIVASSQLQTSLQSESESNASSEMTEIRKDHRRGPKVSNHMKYLSGDGSSMDEQDRCADVPSLGVFKGPSHGQPDGDIPLQKDGILVTHDDKILYRADINDEDMQLFVTAQTLSYKRQKFGGSGVPSPEGGTPGLSSIVFGETCIEAPTSLVGSLFLPPSSHRYRQLQQKMFICQNCLLCLHSQLTFNRHVLKCAQGPPPGREIYRDGKLSVFEADAQQSVTCKIYCYNLVLLTAALSENVLQQTNESSGNVATALKLALPRSGFKEPAKDVVTGERGSLDKEQSQHILDYYSWLVTQCRFYILIKTDSVGRLLIGFFSLDKYDVERQENINLLMVLPHHRGKGYGQFLVAFSHKLFVKSGRRDIWTAARCQSFSDAAKSCLNKYHRTAVIEFLHGRSGKPFTLPDISAQTGIDPECVRDSLLRMGIASNETFGISASALADDGVINKLYNELVTNGDLNKKFVLNESALLWSPASYTADSAQCSWTDYTQSLLQKYIERHGSIKRRLRHGRPAASDSNVNSPDIHKVPQSVSGRIHVITKRKVGRPKGVKAGYHNRRNDGESINCESGSSNLVQHKRGRGRPRKIRCMEPDELESVRQEIKQTIKYKHIGNIKPKHAAVPTSNNDCNADMPQLEITDDLIDVPQLDNECNLHNRSFDNDLGSSPPNSPSHSLSPAPSPSPPILEQVVFVPSPRLVVQPPILNSNANGNGRQSVQSSSDDDSSSSEANSSDSDSTSDSDSDESSQSNSQSVNSKTSATLHIEGLTERKLIDSDNNIEEDVGTGTCIKNSYRNNNVIACDSVSGEETVDGSHRYGTEETNKESNDSCDIRKNEPDLIPVSSAATAEDKSQQSINNENPTKVDHQNQNVCNDVTINKDMRTEKILNAVTPDDRSTAGEVCSNGSDTCVTTTSVKSSDMDVSSGSIDLQVRSVTGRSGEINHIAMHPKFYHKQFGHAGDLQNRDANFGIPEACLSESSTITAEDTTAASVYCEENAKRRDGDHYHSPLLPGGRIEQQDVSLMSRDVTSIVVSRLDVIPENTAKDNVDMQLVMAQRSAPKQDLEASDQVNVDITGQDMNCEKESTIQHDRSTSEGVTLNNTKPDATALTIHGCKSTSQDIATQNVTTPDTIVTTGNDVSQESASESTVSSQTLPNGSIVASVSQPFVSVTDNLSHGSSELHMQVSLPHPVCTNVMSPLPVPVSRMRIFSSGQSPTKCGNSFSGSSPNSYTGDTFSHPSPNNSGTVFRGPSPSNSVMAVNIRSPMTGQYVTANVQSPGSGISTTPGGPSLANSNLSFSCRSPASYNNQCNIPSPNSGGTALNCVSSNVPSSVSTFTNLNPPYRSNTFQAPSPNSNRGFSSSSHQSLHTGSSSGTVSDGLTGPTYRSTGHQQAHGMPSSQQRIMSPVQPATDNFNPFMFTVPESARTSMHVAGHPSLLVRQLLPTFGRLPMADIDDGDRMLYNVPSPTCSQQSFQHLLNAPLDIPLASSKNRATPLPRSISVSVTHAMPVANQIPPSAPSPAPVFHQMQPPAAVTSAARGDISPRRQHISYSDNMSVAPGFTFMELMRSAMPPNIHGRSTPAPMGQLGSESLSVMNRTGGFAQHALLKDSNRSFFHQPCPPSLPELQPNFTSPVLSHYQGSHQPQPSPSPAIMHHGGQISKQRLQQLQHNVSGPSSINELQQLTNRYYPQQLQQQQLLQYARNSLPSPTPGMVLLSGTGSNGVNHLAQLDGSGYPMMTAQLSTSLDTNKQYSHNTPGGGRKIQKQASSRTNANTARGSREPPMESSGSIHLPVSDTSRDRDKHQQLAGQSKGLSARQLGASDTMRARLTVAAGEQLTIQQSNTVLSPTLHSEASNNRQILGHTGMLPLATGNISGGRQADNNIARPGLHSPTGSVNMLSTNNRMPDIHSPTGSVNIPANSRMPGLNSPTGSINMLSANSNISSGSYIGGIHPQSRALNYPPYTGFLQQGGHFFPQGGHMIPQGSQILPTQASGHPQWPTMGMMNVGIQQSNNQASARDIDAAQYMMGGQANSAMYANYFNSMAQTDSLGSNRRS